jgi:hypothetical protein
MTIGVSVTFENLKHGPLIAWQDKKGNGGHVHIDQDFTPSRHAENCFLFEKHLSEIMNEALSRETGAK